MAWYDSIRSWLNLSLRPTGEVEGSLANEMVVTDDELERVARELDQASASLLDALHDPAADLATLLDLPPRDKLFEAPERLHHHITTMLPSASLPGDPGDLMGEIRSLCAREDWLQALPLVSCCRPDAPELRYLLDMGKHGTLWHAMVATALFMAAFRANRNHVTNASRFLERFHAPTATHRRWDYMLLWVYMSSRWPAGRSRYRALISFQDTLRPHVHVFRGACVWVRESPEGGMAHVRDAEPLRFLRLEPRDIATLPPYASWSLPVGNESFAQLSSPSDLVARPDGAFEVLGGLAPQDALYVAGDGLTRLASEVEVLYEPDPDSGEPCWWVWGSDRVDRFLDGAADARG